MENTVNFLLNLIATFVVYSGPIFIYRYLIHRGPVEKKKAKIITIVYGIISFILMTVLIYLLNGSGAVDATILLYGALNYYILQWEKNQQEIDAQEEPENPVERNTETIPSPSSDNSKSALLNGQPINEKKTYGPLDPPMVDNEARPKSFYAAFILTVLCVALAASTAFLAYRTYTLSKSLDATKTELQKSENNYLQVKIDKDRIQSRLDSIYDEYDFYHEYAVIVTAEGGKYHRYGCSHIEGREFWIYNIDAAESKGYEPCRDCVKGKSFKSLTINGVTYTP